MQGSVLFHEKSVGAIYFDVSRKVVDLCAIFRLQEKSPKRGILALGNNYHICVKIIFSYSVGPEKNIEVVDARVCRIRSDE